MPANCFVRFEQSMQTAQITAENLNNTWTNIELASGLYTSRTLSRFSNERFEVVSFNFNVLKSRGKFGHLPEPFTFVAPKVYFQILNPRQNEIQSSTDLPPAFPLPLCGISTVDIYHSIRPFP